MHPSKEISENVQRGLCSQ